MAGALFRNLEARLEEVKKEERVEGVAWGQKNGFAVINKGLDPGVSGYSMSLLKNAHSIHNDWEAPIVCIEGEHSSFLIKSDGDHILTVRRRNL